MCQPVEELRELFGGHLDRSVFDNAQLLWDAICGAYTPTVETLDLRIAQLLYAGAPEARRERIRLVLDQWRRREDERREGLLQQCGGCRSLLSILPLDLLVAAVKYTGSTESLASVNLRAPSLLRLFEDHPLVREAENKRAAVRTLAGVVALAARVDRAGGEPYDFGEKLRRRLGKARGCPKSAAPKTRTHRGGTKRRKRIHATDRRLRKAG